ncbi:hypothetical protein KQY30_24960 [Streptomyces sp. GMY02]|uniref:hypothetical protein n=1 Tax=Streptomyces sp. GMY02 TaxID=1333528 RepID=UPI001C2BD79C|nr:hypothetical protein [Streptomyces sp. GMY02]QXE36977.1 hypothetical protein KQY30_24960 [Streptomyces sp. GMY02]
MARVRYIGPEPVIVPELGQGRVVGLDEVVTVPDSRFDAYVCQPQKWEPVEEPKDEQPPAAAPVKETAAKPLKEG